VLPDDELNQIIKSLKEMKNVSWLVGIAGLLVNNDFTILIPLM